MQAAVGIDMERAVGNELVDKHRTNDAAIDAWPIANSKVAYASSVVRDVVDEVGETSVGGIFFLCFPLWSVYIHKRQSDIRLRHNQRNATLEANANKTEVVLKDLHSLAHSVASRAHGIAIVVVRVADA